MALQAAKGMLYLHSLRPPVLHRDLKSPNLLVQSDVSLSGRRGSARVVGESLGVEGAVERSRSHGRR
eukprot:768368-Hanusia_phi.AAC.1